MSEDLLKSPADSGVAKFERQNFVLALALFFSVLLAFIIILSLQYIDFKAYDNKVLCRNLSDFVMSVDHEFGEIEGALDAIRISAEYDLFNSGKTAFQMPFAFRFLQVDRENGSINMDSIPDEYKGTLTANLTGFVSAESIERDPNLRRRIAMRLNLMDDFSAFKKRIDSVVYLYTISKDRTLLQFPWMPSSEYKFDDKLYDYEVWKSGLPENNKERKSYWTNAYFEFEGGLMASCAAPVYDGDQLTGIIGADIAVEFLNKIAESFEPARLGRIVIYDDDKNLIAAPGIISHKDKAIKKLPDAIPAVLSSRLSEMEEAPVSELKNCNGWNYVKYNMAHGKFHLLYMYPAPSLWTWILEKTGIEYFATIICIFLILVLTLIMTHRKLIAPSEKFVNYILAKSRSNDALIGKGIPSFWKPWFETVRKVFEEKAALTENLKSRNKLLTEEIEARNKAEKEKLLLEQQLIQQEKVKAIGLLAGGVAHDFNNQLAIIMGHASLILSRPNLNEEQKRLCIEQILSAATSSSDLTKQLLAFARKGSYQLLPVNMHEMIEDVVTIVHRTFDKRISVRSSLDAAFFTVAGDPSQIQNLLVNLALNAKNAMPDGGMLSISTRDKILTHPFRSPPDFECEAGTYLEITITDTGTGMSEEVMKKIFEPFFTTNNSGAGTGLGLAAASGTVKTLKGAISVKSSPGAGTTFTILLPVLLENALPKKARMDIELKQASRKVNILLVDDEKAFCRMITDFLGALGYMVHPESDPLAALEYYKDNYKSIDLVITDIMMPKLSGAALLKEFVLINPAVCVVIASGYGDDASIEALKEHDSHVLEFFRKPFNLPAFANGIASICSKLGKTDELQDDSNPGKMGL